MLLKKFYIPIGILILVICAVGLLSLRSDTPTEPIKIYKVTTPTKVSTTPTETSPETAKRENNNGHPPSHATETSAQLESRQDEDWEIPQDTLNASESIAFGGEMETQTFKPPSEEELAEMHYDIAAAKYYKAMQEYNKKFQANHSEWKKLQEEYDKLLPDYEVFWTKMSEAERREIRGKIATWEKKLALVKKEEEKILSEKPVKPIFRGRKNQ